MNEISSVCNYFISAHLPIDDQLEKDVPARKSALKQKEYDIKFEES
jgi:methionine-rich copper-binding protein CopC